MPTIRVILNQKTGQIGEIDSETYESWPQSIKDQFPKAENDTVESERPVFEYYDANT